MLFPGPSQLGIMCSCLASRDPGGTKCVGTQTASAPGVMTPGKLAALGADFGLCACFTFGGRACCLPQPGALGP